MKPKLIFSTLVAAMLFIGGMFLVERNGDSADEIARFETQLESAFQPKQIQPPANLQGRFGSIVQIAPAWTEVERLTTGLTWSNQQVAIARGLMKYESRPGDVYEFRWDERFVKSQQPWQIEEAAAFQVRRIGLATAAAGAGFCVSLAILLIFSWLWGALLRRVRELSNAIRGKE